MSEFMANGIMSYTYKDFITGKIHKTKARFAGWTKPNGLLNVCYAIFERPKSTIFVPTYCLTKETRRIINQNS